MTAQLPTVPVRSARAVASAGAIVGAATVAVNALAFVLPALAPRLLTPADLGAFAAVLAVGNTAAVVGVGLQTALAVHWARREAVAGADRVSVLTAGVTAGVLLLATPLLAALLDVPAMQPLLVALMTFPVVLAGRWIGELQGRQQYWRLAFGMAIAALGRYGGVLLALAQGLGVTASLAVGVVTASIALAGLMALTPRPATDPTSAASGLDAATPDERVSARQVLRAGAATIAMLAVSSADLVLARILLHEDDAGAYAVGAVLARGALWAPGVLTVLALPMIAQARLYAVRITLALTGVVGIVLVALAAGAHDFAIALAGGSQYTHLGPYAGGFALLGALYAMAFVIVNSEIAAGMPRPALWLWVALVVVIVVTLAARPTNVGAMLTIALATAAVTAVLTSVTFKLLRMREKARREAAEALAETAS